MLTPPPAKKGRTLMPLTECRAGMTNLALQTKVAFVSFPPHTSRTGMANINAELYDASLVVQDSEPLKLTVMGLENMSSMLPLKFHTVAELDGVSCTDYQGMTLIVGDDAALI
eukprot:6480874-Amphidinium_carterae.1